MSDATGTFLRLHLSLLVVGLGLPPLAIAGSGQEPAATVPQSALQACASIAANPERLACYDRLSRSVAVPPNAASQSGAVPATAAAQVISPPGAAGTPAASPAAPNAATPSKDSFGLYAQEHPKPPPPAPSLQAAVVALGKSASGHMTVSLAGGALWELEATDPILAVGDDVTITRGALGSYLLHTPTKRIYRARRLH